MKRGLTVVWWRSMFALSLVAMLSATPARQVEAAADLARTMADAGEGSRCEEVDGGVGDDSLEATRGHLPAYTLAGVDLTGTGASRLIPLDRLFLHQGWVPAAPREPDPPIRGTARQARLGCFRY